VVLIQVIYVFYQDSLCSGQGLHSVHYHRLVGCWVLACI